MISLWRKRKSLVPSKVEQTELFFAWRKPTQWGYVRLQEEDGFCRILIMEVLQAGFGAVLDFYQVVLWPIEIITAQNTFSFYKNPTKWHY